MSSTTEVGHAKNVANFEDLISFCTAYGAAYNPSKVNIKLPALNTQLTASRATIVAVNNAITAFNNAVNARVVAFESLKKLTTRLVNALEATDSKKQTVADAKGIARKLQGRRADPLPIPPTGGTGGGTGTGTGAVPSDNSISVAQLSYDSLIENFSKMVILLSNEPLYLPNENELKVAALNTLVTNLKAANTAVISATTVLSNARITRNKALYLIDTGLHDIAQEVKKYVKSLFGATSPEYKQVSKLKFVAFK